MNIISVTYNDSINYKVYILTLLSFKRKQKNMVLRKHIILTDLYKFLNMKKSGVFFSWRTNKNICVLLNSSKLER